MRASLKKSQGVRLRGNYKMPDFLLSKDLKNFLGVGGHSSPRELSKRQNAHCLNVVSKNFFFELTKNFFSEKIEP